MSLYMRTCSLPLQYRDKAGSFRDGLPLTSPRNAGVTGAAAAVLASCRRPFTVGKPSTSFKIYLVRVSPGHLNERLSWRTPRQHRITSTRVLQCHVVDAWRKRASGLGCPGGRHRERREAHGDGGHRPASPLRGVRGRARLPDGCSSTALSGRCGHTR